MHKLHTFSLEIRFFQHPFYTYTCECRLIVSLDTKWSKNADLFPGLAQHRKIKKIKIVKL